MSKRPTKTEAKKATHTNVLDKVLSAQRGFNQSWAKDQRKDFRELDGSLSYLTKDQMKAKRDELVNQLKEIYAMGAKKATRESSHPRGPWYNPDPAVRDFFEGANLGTYNGRQVSDMIKAHNEAGLPYTRGLIMSLLHRFADSNKMVGKATSNRGLSPDDENYSGGRLGASDDFAQAFGDIMRKDFSDTKVITPSKKNAKGEWIDHGPWEMDNFPRLYLTTLANSLIPKDTNLNLTFIDSDKEAYTKAVNDALARLNEQELLNVQRMDPRRKTLQKDEKYDHLSSGEYVRLATRVSDDPSLNTASRVADLQGFLSNLTRDVKLTETRAKKRKRAQSREVKKRETKRAPQPRRRGSRSARSSEEVEEREEEGVKM